MFIAEAVHDENHRARGGKAGDQTGDEVRIVKWYAFPWKEVYRINNVEIARKIAKNMVDAAENPNIGYDQDQRNTLHTELLKNNYNFQKVDKKCEVDCSSLQTAACIGAGIKSMEYTGNAYTTRDIGKALVKAGFSLYISKEMTDTYKNLLPGDILLSPGHHVATFVGNYQELSEKIGDLDKLCLLQLAQLCISGVIGNGSERKKKLGPRYKLVQNIVNNILVRKPLNVQTIDALAEEVIKGAYGDGDERRDALGDYYSVVQSRVNSILKEV